LALNYNISKTHISIVNPDAISIILSISSPHGDVYTFVTIYQINYVNKYYLSSLCPNQKVSWL